MDFLYKARTREGRVVKGVIRASSKKSALDILEKYGLFATSLKQAGRRVFFMQEISIGGVSAKTKVAFTRQLAVMLKAGLSPVEALRAQVSQTESSSFREKILEITESVERGVPLSEALSEYPKVFDQFFINIVRSGEQTGKLAEALEYLADYEERQYNLSQKVLGALIYPAFVIVTLILSLFLVSYLIVPKIKAIFANFDQKLPLSTRLLFWFTDNFRALFSSGRWIILLIVPGALFFFIRRFKRYPILMRWYSWFSLRVPIMGSFYKKIYIVQFAENLSVLLKSGVSISTSLEITHNIIKNKIFKDVIKEAKNKVETGGKMSQVLAQYPRVFPPFVTEMVATGERIGKLAEILENIGNFYQPQIERTAENLTTILEPVLLLVMAVGVGLLAGSVFIPLFQIGIQGLR